MWLESGQAISTLGSSVSELAFLLLILSLTHSPVQTGLISSLRALPFFVLALPAGVWVDRWNRKTLIILCDLGRALSLASIPLALAIGQLTLIQLYCNALIEGALFTLFNIAITASLPRVVSKEQLTRATAVDYVVSQTASLIGPAIGTLLFSLRQALPFLIDAGSYLGSIISMFRIKAEFQPQAAPSASRHLYQEIREGFTAIWGQAVLRYQAFAGCGLNLVLSANVLVVTLLAKGQHASNLTIGLIFTMASGGGILGSLVAERVQRRFSFGQVMSGMFWGLTLLWLLYIFAPNAVGLGMITAGLFACESIGSIVNISYRLAITPDKLQGRVNSVHRLGNGLGGLCGPVIAGLLWQYFSATVMVCSFFGVLLVLAIATLLNPAVRAARRF